MQYIFIIHGAQMGVGILTLPRNLAEIAGTDSWIAVLLSWMIAVLASTMIILILQRHSQDTIFDLLRRYFGRYVGQFFSIIWIVYTACIFIMVFISSVLILKTWILPQTDIFLLVLLFVIPLFLVARNGIRVIGRYSQIVFFLTIWLIFLFVFALEDVNWPNLLPVLKEGWLPVMGSVPVAMISFLGFELAFLLYPFLIHKKQAIKGNLIANSITLFVYLFLIIINFSYFSPYGITTYRWPTISLLKLIELPMLERLEVPVMSLYLLVFSTTVIPYLFFTVFGVKYLFQKCDHQKILASFLFIVVIVSIFYSPSYTEVEQLTSAFGSIPLLIIFVYAIFLWIYGFFHKGRDVSS